jgi:hypothetical protein
MIISRYLLTLLFIIALTCFGGEVYGENVDGHFFASKIQIENHKLSKSFSKIVCVESKASIENSNIQFFGEKEFDDDDKHDAFLSKAKHQFNYAKKPSNAISISTKSGFIKIPLFILYCCLKLHFII